MGADHGPDGSRLHRRALLAGLGTTALGALAGCSGGKANDPGANQTTAPGTASATPTPGAADPAGSLSASPGKPSVGDELTITGADLPANAAVAIEWERVTGNWAVTQASTVVGAQYTSAFEQVGTARTDVDGRFTATITVPEDHGGNHALRATRDGTVVADGSVRVAPTFELDRTTAPLGESFTLSVTGMPSSKYRRNDQILWDNGFAGLLTGVTNRGTVRAEIPATGPPGTHVLEVGGGYEGSTYLNPQQSPYPREPRYADWTVEVTESTKSAGDRWIRPQVDERPTETFYIDLEAPQGSLSLSSTSGPVGATTTVTGSGFPARESVRLQWLTMTGSRVSGSGFSQEASELATVTTDASGRFEREFTVPDDLGGTHPIVATVGGKRAAVTGYVIQPSIASFGPASGPEGTEITVHLKGVGWTEYDNIYTVTYDNDFVGYGCGFNTQGDVEMQFRASGEPGLHHIGCVPAIYKKPGEDRTVDFYTRPQLTYRDDHPVRTLPAMGFLFELTE
ncbi:MAG: hypothetical protein ABEJ31_01825 [Haloarculaceae archaeon]